MNEWMNGWMDGWRVREWSSGGERAKTFRIGTKRLIVVSASNFAIEKLK
jgi:hypothetical protein